MKTLATFNPQAFAAAATCQAVRDVRYYLNGVHIEEDPDGGIMLEGTDGHCMIRVTDRKGVLDTTDLIVFIDSQTITKMKQVRYQKATLLQDDEEDIQLIKLEGLEPTGRNLRLPDMFIGTAKVIDGRFPNTDKVLPKKLPKTSVTTCPVNSSILQKFADAAKILQVKSKVFALVNGEKNEAVCIRFGQPDTAYFARKTIHARGVIMPVYMTENEIPWLPAVPEKLNGEKK
jgi:DNA polymerase III sliding clamp (beta) subunit (PCNA family)